MSRFFAALTILGLAFVLPIAASASPTPCASTASWGAQILKAPVGVGERVAVDAEVQSTTSFGVFPPDCAISHVSSVGAFSDGTTVQLAVSGNVPRGTTRYFTEHVVVTPGMITEDPSLGPVMRLSVQTTAVAHGQSISGSATYTVGATDPPNSTSQLVP